MRGAAAGHAALDRAVDKCYRPADFPSARARVEYLFQLYEQLTAPPAPAHGGAGSPASGSTTTASGLAPTQSMLIPAAQDGGIARSAG